MIFKGGYKITQRYGENPAYYQKYGFAAHEGLDLIPQDSDWNIYCVEGGGVLQDVDATKNNYGIYAVIWNSENKRAWWYCHLKENYLQAGQEVGAGEKIGVMGSSGRVFGAHLHLGLRLTNEKAAPINLDDGYKGFVDPLPILRKLETYPKEVIPTAKLDELEARVGELEKDLRTAEQLKGTLGKNLTGWGESFVTHEALQSEVAAVNAKLGASLKENKEAAHEASVTAISEAIENGASLEDSPNSSGGAAASKDLATKIVGVLKIVEKWLESR